MDSLEKLMHDIKDYGKPYEKLIISKKFLGTAVQELRSKSGREGPSVKSSIMLPFPNIEMSDEEDFDYKFLP